MKLADLRILGSEAVKCLARYFEGEKENNLVLRLFLEKNNHSQLIPLKCRGLNPMPTMQWKWALS